MNDCVVECRQLTKLYTDSGCDIEVLQGVDLPIARGERVAIVGASGSGKSTLLQLLGGLDQPTQGRVFIAGKAIAELSETALCRWRNRQLGFIYQFHHLLPELSALENVAMPMLLAEATVTEARERAAEILTTMGLANRLSHKPAKLSGGERQRVAISRALVNRPACVLADEPTGNLDQLTAAQVFDKMLVLNKQYQTSLVIVTHDLSLAKRMDRCFELRQGRLVQSS